jgi:hypothetical protein
MPVTSIPFESPTYWDARFTRSPQSFDWLVAPDVLIPPLLAALAQYPASPAPLVLHTGCGTSGLSNLLRCHVPPYTALNVDFSQRAIELGVEREREQFGSGSRDVDKYENGGGGGIGSGTVSESMRWATADLLNWESIQRVFEREQGDSRPTSDCHESSFVQKGNSTLGILH